VSLAVQALFEIPEPPANEKQAFFTEKEAPK